MHADIEKIVISKGKSASARTTFAQVLYNRGLINSMLGVEAIRTAQEKYGKKPMTGEQVRWGFENLDLIAGAHQGAGLRGHAEADQVHLRRTTRAPTRPASSSGTARRGRSSPTTTRRTVSILDPMVKERPPSTPGEKKITPRDCSKES